MAARECLGHYHGVEMIGIMFEVGIFMGVACLLCLFRLQYLCSGDFNRQNFDTHTNIVKPCN